MDAVCNVSAWEAHNAIQGHVQYDASRSGSPCDFEWIVSASNDQDVRKPFRMD